jgi:hypothetical protein
MTSPCPRSRGAGRLGEGVRMDIQTYLEQRDTFFAMEVLRAVTGPLKDAGVSSEESRRLILQAFERANEELRRIQSMRFTDDD